MIKKTKEERRNEEWLEDIYIVKQGIKHLWVCCYGKLINKQLLPP